jgi:hypothetical protein
MVTFLTTVALIAKVTVDFPFVGFFLSLGAITP